MCVTVWRSQVEEIIEFCRFKVEAFPLTLHSGTTLRLSVNLTPETQNRGCITTLTSSNVLQSVMKLWAEMKGHCLTIKKRRRSAEEEGE